MLKKIFGKFQYNSPVILTYTILCALALLINRMTGGAANDHIFMIFRTKLTDPMQYIRMLTYVFGHGDYSHFIGNFTIILLVGPMLEEKYGSKPLLKMIMFTAIITALIQVIFFPTVGLLGASGIAFMLILLSSFANNAKGRIPITLILVALIYLSGEILDGVLKSDSVSQMAHIIGGFCGCLFGWAITKPKASASE